MRAARRTHADRREPDARSDAELMRAIGDGDLGALGMLYDRHHEAVRQFLLRVTGSRADMDDVAHEVFLTAARAASSYDGRPSARPFLIGIAAQLLRRRKRTLRRWTEALSTLTATLATSLRRTPEDAACVGEELALFERALAGLSADKRLVFLMVEREGLSGDEVARRLGIPVATVWTRLHAARSALRGALAKETP